MVTNTHFSVTFTHILPVCFFFVLLLYFTVHTHTIIVLHFQIAVTYYASFTILPVVIMHHIACCIVCVCVCTNCALPGHTTYTVCMVYRLRTHCTVHSAHLPCLLLKRNSFVCLLSPIPFNCCQIYQSVTKADVDLYKCITKLRAKNCLQ